MRVQCSMAYLATRPGVVRGAAGDDEDLVDVAQVLVGQAHLVERELAGLGEPAEQRVGDGLRLLGDLLEHEVVVAALLGGRGVPVDVEVACPRPGLPSKSVISMPSAVISTTWSWPSSTASRVCSMNAETSLARKFSPSPRPTTSGELRRAPTTAPGASASTASRVNAPSSRRQTRRIASASRSPGRPALRRTRGQLGGEQVGGALGVGVAGELDAVGLQLGAQPRRSSR